MITLWLAYATILTLAVAVAAHTMEMFCRVIGKPARIVWGLGICLAVAVPPGLIAARSRTTAAPVSVPVSQVTATGHVSTTRARDDQPGGGAVALRTPFALARPRLTFPVAPGWLDMLLLRLWGAGSALLLIVVAASMVRTARRRRGWSLALLDGVVVHVSDDVGPALVGVRKPRIVVPRWVLNMGAEEQRLILAHEREHARAADQLLVAGATLAVICEPWNLGLWYMLRRLRLAVEVDCDRRVMRQHADVRGYCDVLLGVGERMLSHPVLSTALARAKSDLRCRIEQLVGGPPQLSSGRLASGVAMSGALLFLSCAVPNKPATRPEPAASPRTATTRGAEKSSTALDALPGVDSLLATGPRGDSEVGRLLGRDSSDDSLVARLQGQLRLADTSFSAAPLLDTFGTAPDLVVRDSAAYTALRRLLESRSDSVAGSLTELVAALGASTPNIRDAIARYFPDELTPDRHVASGLWFLVDANGAVVQSRRTEGAHAPAISAEVVGQRFAGIATESIDEVRILSGRAVGLPDDWVVWAVLRPGIPAR